MAGKQRKNREHKHHRHRHTQVWVKQNSTMRKLGLPQPGAPRSHRASRATRNNTKTKQTKQNTPKTSNVKSDRRSSWETIDEGEVIALYQLRYWMAENKTKEKTENTKKHIAISPSEWSNTALCGNQGSPQPGSPRSHRASHQGITTHNKRTLRCQQRQRRIATKVVRQQWKRRWEGSRVRKGVERAN